MAWLGLAGHGWARVILTWTEKEFVSWYRAYFKTNKGLPCLKCSDLKILRCSRIDTGRTKTIVCKVFKDYQQKVAHR